MAKKNDNLQALSTIERALGMIEGISYGVDEPCYERGLGRWKTQSS